MTFSDIEYEKLRRRGWLRWLSLGVVVFLLGLALPINRVEERMDTVTGSTSWKTVWYFGLTSGPRLDVSPLETRLKNSGIPWTADWRYMGGTFRNIIGFPLGDEVGRGAAIYRIHNWLGKFADASTDAQLREFVRVMQSGNDEEQRAAVDAAIDRTLLALQAAQPGG